MIEQEQTDRSRTLGGRLDDAARRLVLDRLSRIQRGRVVVVDRGDSFVLGDEDTPRAEVTVHRPSLYRNALLGGTLAVAESYCRGDWDCDDLTALIRIFIRNRAVASGLDGAATKIAAWGHRLYHWLHANTRSQSQRNISAHYDLGNEFFAAWLDDTMAYSSGIFSSPNGSLREASTEKFDRVCRKLDLSPDDHLLEIGTGWGAMAVHAAGRYGCRVTTTTISRQQHDAAERRIAAAGLSDRVTLLSRDYRELRGEYDKLVSIEMIEAVGHRYLDDYFRQCGRLLRPDGTMVLQAIVMPERGYANYLRSVDFIQRYIFPGGCLPSVAAILESAGRSSDLRLVHVEDFAPHYAETLRRWRRGFSEREREFAKRYSPSFVRLWRYYLCYCEAAFEERHVGVVHVQFDKPGCRRDPIAITQRAAQLRAHPLDNAAPLEKSPPQLQEMAAGLRV